MRFTFTAHEGVPGYDNMTYGNASWTYHNGDWRGVCDAHSFGHSGDTAFDGTIHRDISAATPPHWPLFMTKTPGAPGTAIAVWEMGGGCSPSEQTGVYRGTDTEPTTRNGQAVTAATYWANATDEEEQHYRSLHAEWSRATGLVVSYTDARLHSGASGRLTDTDAPL